MRFRELAKLQSQVTLVQQRTKEMFYVFSALLAAGTQTGMTLAAWKRRNGLAMRGWLAAWAEFEALSALANYAFEHPEDAWPELLADGAARFEATRLGHPLLPGCVRNDVSLGVNGGEARFYLISGSNMSGKSTLLRSMGINAVLAYCGGTGAGECDASDADADRRGVGADGLPGGGEEQVPSGGGAAGEDRGGQRTWAGVVSGG